MTGDPVPATRKSFLWLKLTGCGCFGLLIAGVLIVGVFDSSRASNQRVASTSLRTIGMAEMDFRSNMGVEDKRFKFWVGDVSRLYYLENGGGTIKLIDLSIASADAAPKGALAAPHAKEGYLFAAVKLDETGAPYDEGMDRNASKFAFCAYPQEYRPKSFFVGKDAVTTLTFIINEYNIVWQKDLKGAAVTRWPRDPRGEGWSHLD